MVKNEQSYLNLKRIQTLQEKQEELKLAIEIVSQANPSDEIDARMNALEKVIGEYSWSKVFYIIIKILFTIFRREKICLLIVMKLFWRWLDSIKQSSMASMIIKKSITRRKIICQVSDVNLIMAMKRKVSVYMNLIEMFIKAF